MKNKITSLVSIIVLSAFMLISCNPQSLYPGNDRPVDQEENKTVNNTRLGIPQWTYEGPQGDDDYLIERDSFTLSYNNSAHIPNWVSWHLTRKDTGRLPRPDSFRADDALPQEWEKVNEDDYNYSSYAFQRGHMCPNADRSGYAEMQNDTFVMTNMVPQAPNNNEGGWADLEYLLRKLWIRKGYEAYVVAGPHGIGGDSFQGSFDEIESLSTDDNNDPSDDNITITVPAYTWKVVIIIPEGLNDIERIEKGDDVTAIAIWMPNSNMECNKNDSFMQYVTSIDFVEEQTGLDFFSLLDDRAEAAVESRIYNGYREAV